MVLLTKTGSTLSTVLFNKNLQYLMQRETCKCSRLGEKMHGDTRKSVNFSRLKSKEH